MKLINNIKSILTNSEKETRNFAKKIAKNLTGSEIILLNGDLGAGKTAFTKGLGDFFNICDQVISPTFNIVNEYKGDLDLYHFDFYRIEEFSELLIIDYLQYVFKEGIVVVEWADKFPEAFLDFDSLKVKIEKLDQEKRKIIISK